MDLSATRKVTHGFGRTICIRLGHESLDVTLAYLKGKDAESEEAQEHTKQQRPGAVRLES